jgi:hypothetical protein
MIDEMHPQPITTTHELFIIIRYVVMFELHSLLGGLGILLQGDDLIVTHGTHHTNTVGLARLESCLDFTGKGIRVIRELHVLAHVAFLIHEGGVAIGRDIHQGILLAHDVGDVGSVSGGDDIFVLLASENINSGEVALGVAVLASLGSGHSRHLARMLLDTDVPVPKQQQQDCQLMSATTVNEDSQNKQKITKKITVSTKSFDSYPVSQHNKVHNQNIHIIYRKPSDHQDSQGQNTSSNQITRPLTRPRGSGRLPH